MKEHSRHKLLKIASSISNNFYFVFSILFVMLFILSKVKAPHLIEKTLLAMTCMIIATLFLSVFVEAILTGEASTGGFTFKKTESPYSYYIALSIYIVVILMSAVGVLANLIFMASDVGIQ